MRNPDLKQGDIYLVDFSENSVGHEYQKKRPAIIIQSNLQIKKSNLVTIMPLSTKLDKALKEDILVEKDNNNLLLHDSVIKVQHIISFDPVRFSHKIGEVKKEVLSEIKNYLTKHFDL
ncbi:MAG: type II toxin-antitoxin system PemK/MazF family toxin [Candidatus Magasanikbacteria bacterium]|nr:type II toxin-antitoxin system PemK/MazF family toxin [Candidatus Magasanikbacteria bacterium]